MQERVVRAHDRETGADLAHEQRIQTPAVVVIERLVAVGTLGRGHVEKEQHPVPAVAIELLKAAKDIFTDEITVLEPAFFAFLVAHSLPALAVLEDDHFVTVFDTSRFGIHRSHAVAKRGLRCCGDVQDFILLAGTLSARRE